MQGSKATVDKPAAECFRSRIPSPAYTETFRPSGPSRALKLGYSYTWIVIGSGAPGTAHAGSVGFDPGGRFILLHYDFFIPLSHYSCLQILWKSLTKIPEWLLQDSVNMMPFDSRFDWECSHVMTENMQLDELMK